jgi:hypothetical protein
VLGALLDLAKKGDGFSLIAWLGGIVLGKDHLHLDGDDVLFSLNEPSSLDPFARISHCYFNQKCTVTSVADRTTFMA